jgi:hypothetical protein
MHVFSQVCGWVAKWACVGVVKQVEACMRVVRWVGNQVGVVG